MFCLFFTSCGDLRWVLSSYGFTPLRPPNRLLLPGTIVYLKRKNPLEAGIVCTPIQSLGSHFQVEISETAEMLIQKLIELSSQWNGPLTELIQASGTFSEIVQVQVQLQRPVILTVSDTSVRQNLRYRDVDCHAALIARQQAKFTTTMIAASLQADTLFNIRWRLGCNLTGQQKFLLLERLSHFLGIQGVIENNTTFRGQNLIWGVVDDFYLGALRPDTTLFVPREALPAHLFSHQTTLQLIEQDTDQLKDAAKSFSARRIEEREPTK